MKKQQTKTNGSVRFKRFCRARWAAFSSMHREVTIGRLAGYIADRSLRSAAPTAALALMLCAGHQASAQSTGDEPETVDLPTVEIIFSADTLFGSPEPAAVISASDFKQTSVRTIGDLLGLLPGVDLRARGGNDVQADLSMRGGTFDQMVVLLGGINLTDAQTGHHTLDIPIDISMVERIELLSPAQLLARGINSFCGGVNIVVCEQYRDKILADISIGVHTTLHASLLATKTFGEWALTAAAAYNRSDGYIENTDYNFGSLFLQATRHSNNDDWQLQLGGQTKDFGSHAFYSTTYPDQFEATRTLTASALNIHRFANLQTETAIYGRLHRDRFELFRTGYVEPAAWYSGHNHHLGSLLGLRSRALLPISFGTLLTGIDIRRDGIISNVLGTADNDLPAPYTKSATRTTTTINGGYRYSHHNITAEATFLGSYNTAFGFDYGAAIESRYRINQHTTLRASLSRTNRLPTFTDLYYTSATQRADSNLNAEHSLAAELQASYQRNGLSASATTYYRAGTDVIDWVRSNESEMWMSMNHSAVNAVGFDIATRYAVASSLLQAIGGSYSFCDISHDAGNLISGSAIDYLRHKCNIYAVVAPLSKLNLTADIAYRFREGKYIDADGKATAYGGTMLLNIRIEWHLIKDATLYAECRNLFDTPYRDHGGVPLEGRHFLVGIRL